MIGLGGGHLVRPSVSEADAVYLIRTAIDEGITFSRYRLGLWRRRQRAPLREGPSRVAAMASF